MEATIGVDKRRFLESTGIGSQLEEKLTSLQSSPVPGTVVSLFIKSEDEKVGPESSF